MPSRYSGRVHNSSEDVGRRYGRVEAFGAGEPIIWLAFIIEPCIALGFGVAFILVDFVIELFFMLFMADALGLGEPIMVSAFAAVPSAATKARVRARDVIFMERVRPSGLVG
jgi:hypothetical protein